MKKFVKSYLQKKKELELVQYKLCETQITCEESLKIIEQMKLESEQDKENWQKKESQLERSYETERSRADVAELQRRDVNEESKKHKL